MKKIIVIFAILLVFTGCSKKLQSDDVQASIKGKDWVEKKVKENNLIKLYETKYGIKVYSKLKTVTYKDNNRTINLKEALINEEITIENFINKMDYFNASNDGGSVYYVSNSKMSDIKFYVAKCNSLPGNGGIKDIFIDTDEFQILNYCVANY